MHIERRETPRNKREDAKDELRAPSLQVRAVGVSANPGQRLPWRLLHLRHGVWCGVLPAPEFRGVYPLELRGRAGAPVLGADDWLLRKDV
jgi:hypothetical protein